MFFDEAAAPFEPVEGKVLLVMSLAAIFIVGFVLPFIGGTVFDAATAAASALVGAGP